jgi:hypothetical protein
MAAIAIKNLGSQAEELVRHAPIPVLTVSLPRGGESNR